MEEYIFSENFAFYIKRKLDFSKFAVIQYKKESKP